MNLDRFPRESIGWRAAASSARGSARQPRSGVCPWGWAIKYLKHGDWMVHYATLMGDIMGYKTIHIYIYIHTYICMYIYIYDIHYFCVSEQGYTKAFSGHFNVGKLCNWPMVWGISRSLTICHVVRRGHEGHASYPPWVVISNGTPHRDPHDWYQLLCWVLALEL